MADSHYVANRQWVLPGSEPFPTKQAISAGTVSVTMLPTAGTADKDPRNVKAHAEAATHLAIQSRFPGQKV